MQNESSPLVVCPLGLAGSLALNLIATLRLDVTAASSLMTVLVTAGAVLSGGAARTRKSRRAVLSFSRSSGKTLPLSTVTSSTYRPGSFGNVTALSAKIGCWPKSAVKFGTSFSCELIGVDEPNLEIVNLTLIAWPISSLKLICGPNTDRFAPGFTGSPTIGADGSRNR